MKNLIIYLVTIWCFSGCYSRPAAQTTAKVNEAAANNFGKPVTPEGYIPGRTLAQKLVGKDSLAVKVQGVVQSVCQAKGCWMDVKLTDNTPMKVRFRNYGFFVPKDIAGKTVIVQGTAYQETVSVADQQHYLQDAGKSAPEINAIIQPKKEITFIADGVRVE
jgi:hypothetical protein